MKSNKHIVRPCDELSVMIKLKQSTYLSRADSPCRYDYPEKLKKILKNPLEPSDLYNSMLAPNLPYDQDLCENLCTANYWLPKCNCMIYSDIWNYAGQLNSTMPLCKAKTDLQNTVENCTKSQKTVQIPAAALADCQCSKSCQEFSFEVIGYDRSYHDYGKMR